MRVTATTTVLAISAWFLLRAPGCCGGGAGGTPGGGPGGAASAAAAAAAGAGAASVGASTASPTFGMLEEAASLTEEEAVVGGIARLPCDLRPPAPEDEVALVIWYKSGIGSPIYSLDARGRPVRLQPTHWADERTLGGRAFFRSGPLGPGTAEGSPEEAEGAHLAIENVRETDAGAYRCRVDFHRSPTRNALLNLSVIVPPQKLSVLDEDGRVIDGPTIGPFLEGASLMVTCIAEGGHPTPEVRWLRDGVSLPVASSESGGGDGGAGTEATLRLGPLGRRDAGAELLCHATNSRLAPPLRRTMRIRLTLPALDLRLVGENRPLSAHTQQEVACEAIGADPPPTIEWRKAGQPLSNGRQTTSADGNVTRSAVMLEPLPDDMGRELECLVEGEGGRRLRDSWVLDVRFPPELKVSLGANLNASAIREGDDVYLECMVRAHPRVTRVEWRHSGRPLASNASGGVLVSNQTLVLQAVRNASAGPYACAASNLQGHSTSHPFMLDVKYAPVCRPHQQRVYGGARLETLQVSCEVDANPPAALFRWSFNSSAVAAREVTSVASVAGGGRSLAAYTPRAERDFGTLLCWGRNALGAQNEPCVFHVVPAGRPEAPRACAVANRTWSALQVRCSRGFDGGLPQQFTLEVFVAEGAPARRLIANVTSRSAPEFTVTGLEPGADYELTLYATNGKGRSEDSVLLKATTLRAGAHEPRRTVTAAGPDRGSAAAEATGPLLWALAGAGAALAAAGTAAAAATALRRVCCADDDDAASAATSPGADRAKALALKAAAAEAAGAATVAATAAGSTLIVEDPIDNPDVVPHAGDADPQSALRSPVVCAPSPSGAPAPEALALTTATRWQPPLRDSATQATTHAPLHAAAQPSAARRHHAETQTPLPLPKESAV